MSTLRTNCEEIRFSDLAPVLKSTWIAPLRATLLKPRIRIGGPEAASVEVLELVKRWLEDPELDLTQFPECVRLAALQTLAKVHRRLLHDGLRLPPEKALLGAQAAARELLWISITGQLRALMQRPR